MTPVGTWELAATALLAALAGVTTAFWVPQCRMRAPGGAGIARAGPRMGGSFRQIALVLAGLSAAGVAAQAPAPGLVAHSARSRALGLIGVMTAGIPHQTHHPGVAMGLDPNG